eukprot:scaffold105776_cov32-Tisochrysis_lutea.AAC.1
MARRAGRGAPCSCPRQLTRIEEWTPIATAHDTWTHGLHFRRLRAARKAEGWVTSSCGVQH